MKTLRYSVSTERGSYRFRRRWAAKRAFDAIQLSSEEPCVVLSRSDPDGTLHVLTERHFSEQNAIPGAFS